MNVIPENYLETTDKLDELAAYDVFNEVDSLRVGVLNLAKNEHLRVHGPHE